MRPARPAWKSQPGFDGDRILRRPAAPLAYADPPLTDGVVQLDALGEADVDAIVAASDDPRAARWLGLPSPYTTDDARAFLERARAGPADGSSLEHAIRDAATGAHLGNIGLPVGRARAGEAEIGYLVAPHARGRGVATRAVRLLAPWALAAHGLRRVKLLVQPANLTSRRVAAAAGAAYEEARRWESATASRQRIR